MHKVLRFGYSAGLKLPVADTFENCQHRINRCIRSVGQRHSHAIVWPLPPGTLANAGICRAPCHVVP